MSIEAPPPAEPTRLSVQIERGLNRLRMVSARRQWADACSKVAAETLADDAQGDGEPEADSPAVSEAKSEELTSADASEEATFTLAFLDRQGTDVCEIAGLSLGETGWMADVVLRERAGWFR